MRWLATQLTVALDLYSRTVAGLRLTPVSTKAIDVASVLYQAMRPQPAPESWPAHATWPYAGLPKALVADADRIDGPIRGLALPPPDTASPPSRSTLLRPQKHQPGRGARAAPVAFAR